MKKILRSLQVYFPIIEDLKYKVRFSIMKVTKTVHEDDFKVVKWFEPHSGQVFIDIGSNRGEAITSIMNMSVSKTRIIGFEPNEIIYKKLKDYIGANNNVHVHNLGLGDENIDLPLFVPFYRKWSFDGLASFKYENAKDWLRTRMWLYNEKHLRIEETICAIRRLDEFQYNPYFIKIDVEGFELEVLKGGGDTIKKNLPILLIECLTKQCLEYLSPFGYQCYHFSNGGLYEGMGHPNTFCINLKKHPELKKMVKTKITNIG